MKLPKQFLYTPFAPGDPNKYYWDPPEVSDFSSPGDLATLLISYRSRLVKLKKETGKSFGQIGKISIESIKPLLNLAYRASFLTDEGRPVLARLFVPNQLNFDEEGVPELSKIVRRMHEVFEKEWETQTHIHQFVDPIELNDEKMIAKLAPTLVSEDSVLLVQEIDDKPKIIGIGLLNHNDWERQILTMPREGNGKGGLSIEILGPGHLLVAEGQIQFTLRANNLFTQKEAWRIEPVLQWLSQVSNSLIESIISDENWDADDKANLYLDWEFENFPHFDISSIWSRILREALRLRHGGAFVVVPGIPNDNIRIRFTTKPFSICEEIKKTWIALRNVHRKTQGDEILDLIDEKLSATHRLLSATRSIAALSSTDGCVVLDRNMTVHGFGGSIQTHEDSSKPRKSILLQNQREIEASVFLASVGERHKSAYNLCQEVAGSIAFIISQDGDLRVFSNDDTRVKYMDNLFP